MWPEAESQPVGHELKDRVSHKPPMSLPHCLRPTQLSPTSAALTHVIILTPWLEKEVLPCSVAKWVQWVLPQTVHAQIVLEFSRARRILLCYDIVRVGLGEYLSVPETRMSYSITVSPILICISPTLQLRTFLKSIHFLQFFLKKANCISLPWIESNNIANGRLLKTRWKPDDAVLLHLETTSPRSSFTWAPLFERRKLGPIRKVWKLY